MSTLKTQMWKWEGRGRKGEGGRGELVCLCRAFVSGPKRGLCEHEKWILKNNT